MLNIARGRGEGVYYGGVLIRVLDFSPDEKNGTIEVMGRAIPFNIGEECDIGEGRIVKFQGMGDRVRLSFPNNHHRVIRDELEGS